MSEQSRTNDAWPTFLVIYEDSPDDMGLLRAILWRNGCRWDGHRRFSTPWWGTDLGRYTGIISLGGKGEQVDRHEMAWLRRAVRERVPVLGICQGAQNLALAASNKKLTEVSPPDFGLIPLDPSNATTGDPVSKCLAKAKRMCQWHEYAFVPPDGATPLLYSGSGERRHCEAFRLGDRIFGLQFHPEVPGGEIWKWLPEGEEEPSRAECMEIARVGWNIIDAWVNVAIGDGS